MQCAEPVLFRKARPVETFKRRTAPINDFGNAIYEAVLQATQFHYAIGIVLIDIVPPQSSLDLHPVWRLPSILNVLKQIFNFSLRFLADAKRLALFP
jgi:hypothetical protein